MNPKGTPENLISFQPIDPEPTVYQVCTRYHQREADFLKQMNSGDRAKFIRVAVRDAIDRQIQKKLETPPLINVYP